MPVTFSVAPSLRELAYPERLAGAPWANERLRRECYAADGGLIFELDVECSVSSRYHRSNESCGPQIHEMFVRRGLA